jgi:hypothetical protein
LNVHEPDMSLWSGIGKWNACSGDSGILFENKARNTEFD